jgi:glutamine---fructose-6-phosphate transaminase (isomerizing)
MVSLGTAMEAEVHEGPRCIGGAAASAVDTGLRRPAGIVLFARGSSDHAALYGRYVLEALAGMPVILGAPSLVTAYGAPTDLKGFLAVGISQSGETLEIVECLAWAKARGAETVAITNSPRSPLADEADRAIDLRCGPELAVVATKTFLAECAALAALADSWSSEGIDWGLVVDAGERALLAPVDEDLAQLLVDEASLTILGRGFRFPLALELALKVMEACGKWAVGMSWADLLHGPITALPRGSACVLLADRGALGASTELVAARLAGLGMRMHVSAPSMAGEVPEPLRPLLEALRAQLSILSAARALDLDPDSPAGLTKVTQT